MDKIEIDMLYRDWQEAKERLVRLVSLRKPVRRFVSELGIPLKYSGSFALIPENLDIDRHLELYSITDYFFAEDESGHIKTVNRNGTFGYCFDKERLIHIIGLISSIPAGKRDLIKDNCYVPINSSVIRNYFKDYLSYLDYLIQTGILVTDGIAVPEEKSFGYKFSPEYENQPLVRYTYLSARITQPEPVLEERFNSHTRKFERNPLLDYPYLSYWYGQKRLTISSQAKNYAWNRRMHANQIEQGKDYQAQYQAALYNIIALENQEYKAQIDSNVHRLHSVITNIQKDYRNFLKYDNKGLATIDISNSQPFLLCVLLRPEFWDKESNAYINIGHLPENIQKMFSPSLTSRIRRYVSSIPAARLQNYLKEASDGYLYEFMMRKINNPEIDRKKIKTMILITFFSDNRYISQHTEDAALKRKFKGLFPKIYKLIAMCKTSKKNRFACLLQSVESELILHWCCRRIWVEGGHNVPVFTIHDSIATTAENVAFVRQIMDEELFKAAGLHPHFKEETWSEANLELNASSI